MKKGLKKEAFTIIELLVAMAIIAIVTGIFLTNYYGSEGQSQLINGTQSLVRDLRVAQNKNIAGTRYGGTMPYGWGISMSSGSDYYVLFADINGNYFYDSGEELESKGGRIIYLPANVIISSFNQTNQADVLFYNDYDVPQANMSDPINLISFEDDLTIVLADTNTGATKEVYVNRFGLISSNL